MSQLKAPTHTVVDQIPLGRRMIEIMQEKGPAYTISAMAKRLDISRETLRLMLKGEREIYTYELEKMAQDLKVPMERILQSDVQEQRKKADQILFTYKNLEEGDALTESFLQSAIGLTERFYVLNKRGIYWYKSKDYSRAHELWLKALSIARTILEKFGDAESLLLITENLSITYVNRNEKSHLLDLISEVKDYLDENPAKSGKIYYSLGRIEVSEGNLDQAIHSFYQYVEFMERSNNPNNIVRARADLAFFEYNRRNYQKSIEIYTSTLELVQENGDLFFKWNFYQCFARNFIRLHQFDQAKHWLHIAKKTMESIDARNDTYFLMRAHLYFLLAVTENDPRYAEKLVDCENVNLNMRKVACKFLIDYYDDVDDWEAKEIFEKRIRERFVAIDQILYEKEHDVQYLLTLVDLFTMVGWI